MKTVFIHSGWRTGSTYVWNKFRKAPGTLAFYEPFHERLGTEAHRLLSLGSDPERTHHSDLTQPYFAEYRPLVDGAGIRHFRIGFSYRRFFLDQHEPDPDLYRYVAQLIERAAESGCRPILGFSRSLGRVGWLKHGFPSVNLLVTRAPRRQWASIVHQRDRQQISYFLVNQFLICGQNRDHPLIRPLIDVYDIPLVRTSSVDHDIAIYQRLFGDVGDRIGYMVFYYLWRITQETARPHADLVIDLDHLAADPESLTAIQATIARETGLAVSFDDIDCDRYGVACPELDYEEIEAFVASVMAKARRP